MALKTIEQKENRVFNRKELMLQADKSEHEPSYANVMKIISSELGAEISTIKVNKVDLEFGSGHFSIEANIYSSKEERENVEKRSKKEKEAEQKMEEESKQEPEEGEEGSGEEQGSEESKQE